MFYYGVTSKAEANVSNRDFTTFVQSVQSDKFTGFGQTPPHKTQIHTRTPTHHYH